MRICPPFRLKLSDTAAFITCPGWCNFDEVPDVISR
jgi:hypothetical protein